MIKPPYLQPGDTVGIIAPARSISKEEITPFTELINSWGLKCKTSRYLFGKHFQYSGTEKERASDFQQMIDDPEVKAIICARGGYGSIKIIRYIDFSGFQKSPKWLAGFSDVTVLHAYINKFLGTESLHSIMPLNYKNEEKNISVTSLKKALFGEKLKYDIEPHKLNKPGNVTAELTGGNLSLLYSLNGTNFFPDMRNKVLFIEDVDEYLYHIDRMMQNFYHSGVFAKIAGLIVGSFSEIKDNEIPFGMDAYEIIRNTVDKFNFPVCFNFPAGHISENRTLILGREVQLSVEVKGVGVDLGG